MAAPATRAQVLAARAAANERVKAAHAGRAIARAQQSKVVRIDPDRLARHNAAIASVEAAQPRLAAERAAAATVARTASVARSQFQFAMTLAEAERTTARVAARARDRAAGMTLARRLGYID